MPNPLILKLARIADLTRNDRSMLEELLQDVRQVDARRDLIQEGDRPDNVQVILEGFACRYKLLPDGSRQIMALLIPGDFCDLHISILGEMDHNIGTLSHCTVASLPTGKVEQLMTGSFALNRSLWWATLVDEAILREWLVGMGRRPADKQLAHLLCELMVRLEVVGLAENNSYSLPLTQTDLGDVLGLTPVHVNRVLQQLRTDGLIRSEGRQMNILDPAALMEFAEFDPKYLHLQRRFRNKQ